MPSNELGKRFKIVTFGESHGHAVGALIDGVAPNLDISEEILARELAKRRPGLAKRLSSRNETDKPIILSGVFEGKTTGAPICIIIWNEDANSSDYEELKNAFRPGHGDFTWLAKYGIRDWRGGGRLSGRETAARVAAGAIAKELLLNTGIKITARVIEMAGVRAEKFDKKTFENSALKCGDAEAEKAMQSALDEASAEGDSVGGIVEIVASGVPAGLGDPVFDKLDAQIAKAMMSIGGVKGVEFGSGFAAAKMRGCRHNDAIGAEGFLTNNSGGILGGISNGDDIVCRVAVKPTSSIKKTQKTIDSSGNEIEISVKGRHDACIAPRLAPVAEAMIAITLADAYLAQQSVKRANYTIEELRAQIDATDAQLAALIAERIELCKEIGKLKKKKSVSIENLKREEQVVKNWKKFASFYKSDRESAENIAKAIMAECKKAQIKRK